MTDLLGFNYSFRWSCDIDIQLLLYGLHDTTLYYCTGTMLVPVNYIVCTLKKKILSLQYSLSSK